MAAAAPAVRVTERANELTAELDKGDVASMIRRMREVDQQMFAGWREFPSVYDLLDRIARVSGLAASALRHALTGGHDGTGRSVVFVFSGCGTSGRIAWLCSVQLNRLLQRLCPGAPPCFKYRVSGGDEALIVSKELPEDDPHLGASDLRDAVAGYDLSFAFGITCGLSAPYVAGQMDCAMALPGCTAVLIGFNPIELARDVPVEGWDKRCAEVFRELSRRAGEGDPHCHVLNPIVGPEAVTGSSRMKGGSMTMLLLCTVFTRCIADAITPDDGLEEATGSVDGATALIAVRDALSAFERTYREAYTNVEGISSLTEIAGAALRSGRAHLYYISSGDGGLMGMIDASEMVDTYGARLDEVRGFVAEGWASCENNEGDLSALGPLFCVAWADFARDILKQLTPEDTVILVNLQNDARIDDGVSASDILTAVCASPARVGYLHAGACGKVSSSMPPDARHLNAVATVELSVAAEDPLLPFHIAFALKLVLNVVSTGANVIRGAVYGNTMINLTVSNNKLMQRSAEIVASITGCDIATARTALIRAVHRVDSPSEALLSLPASHHIERATPMRNIVPAAALLATGCFTVSEAIKTIDRGDAPLREVIYAAVTKSKGGLK